MPTQDEIREYFLYDCATGEFFLRKTKRSVGFYNERGYFKLFYKGKQYRANRLAWLYMYGEMPNGVVDHIDNNRANNAIENLRILTNEQNLQNSVKPSKGNKSGYRGVRLEGRAKKKWVAEITVNGKTKYLGVYDTPELANQAYLKSKEELHPYWEKI